MIVRKLEDIIGTRFDVDTPNWYSRRLLTASDAVGFSFNDTHIRAGTETLIWYQNHVEAVFCIEGEGEVELTENGQVFPIRAGTLYALNGHERHLLRARTDMRMICVFNPPLTGAEVHDANGVYPSAAGTPH